MGSNISSMVAWELQFSLSSWIITSWTPIIQQKFPCLTQTLLRNLCTETSEGGHIREIRSYRKEERTEMGTSDAVHCLPSPSRYDSSEGSGCNLHWENWRGRGSNRVWVAGTYWGWARFRDREAVQRVGAFHKLHHQAKGAPDAVSHHTCPIFLWTTGNKFPTHGLWKGKNNFPA